MSETLDGVLDALVPAWDKTPPENPPGGALGFRLRLIMEDSKSIFGQSRYSTETRMNNRWKSLEHTDYINPSGTGSHRAASAPEPKERHNNKMFMNWKIPERVTTGDPSRANSRLSRSGSVHKKPGIPHAAPLLTPSALPAIENHTMSKQTPRNQSAIPATPRLPTGAGRENTGISRRSGRSQAGIRPLGVRASAPEFCTPKPSDDKPMSSRKPKSYKISELLSRYYSPNSDPEEWLANATDADRKLIEKALKSIEREKATKPDTTKALESWIQNSNERDRAVALAFFQSLSGGNLAQDVNRKPDKIRTIIEHLQRGRQYPGAVFPADVSRSNDDHKYRYLRLLSPKTRNEKWLHQTWHHLPPSRDDNPVINRTSIYTEPHRYIPRHYVIHPDLG